eukprot:m.297632 g.297632  ORF g.297632 m.297632 type:complete len:535 (-) comp13663_c0_seq1:182-1786(-)
MVIGCAEQGLSVELKSDVLHLLAARRLGGERQNWAAKLEVNGNILPSSHGHANAAERLDIVLIRVHHIRTRARVQIKRHHGLRRVNRGDIARERLLVDELARCDEMLENILDHELAVLVDDAVLRIRLNVLGDEADANRHRRHAAKDAMARRTHAHAHGRAHGAHGFDATLRGQVADSLLHEGRAAKATNKNNVVHTSQSGHVKQPLDMLYAALNGRLEKTGNDVVADVEAKRARHWQLDLALILGVLCEKILQRLIKRAVERRDVHALEEVVEVDGGGVFQIIEKVVRHARLDNLPRFVQKRKEVGLVVKQVAVSFAQKAAEKLNKPLVAAAAAPGAATGPVQLADPDGILGHDLLAHNVRRAAAQVHKENLAAQLEKLARCLKVRLEDGRLRLKRKLQARGKLALHQACLDRSTQHEVLGLLRPDSRDRQRPADVIGGDAGRRNVFDGALLHLLKEPRNDCLRGQLQLDFTYCRGNRRGVGVVKECHLWAVKQGAIAPNARLLVLVDGGKANVDTIVGWLVFHQQRRGELAV